MEPQSNKKQNNLHEEKPTEQSSESTINSKRDVLKDSKSRDGFQSQFSVEMLMFWKSRKYLVNPDFQIKLLVFFSGLVIITLVAIYRVVRNNYQIILDAVDKMGTSSSQVFTQLIVDQSARMAWVFFAAGFLGILFLIVGGLILSNKIAGPLFRLSAHMKKISAGGEMLPFLPRNKDFNHDLFLSYNEMIESLKKRIEKSGGRSQ